MCGRFYIDDDTAKEIERTIRKVDEQLKRERRTGDIRPTDVAAVITGGTGGLEAVPKRWGFPGIGSSKVIINARAESVLERKMFRESVLNRRIIIPAAGFYEWNSKKEKFTFTAPSKPVLYMAGLYNRFEGEDRFVILTTSANDSMADVHDRMPLILEENEFEEWLHEGKRVEEFLHKIPGTLRRHAEYEQQTLQF